MKLSRETSIKIIVAIAIIILIVLGTLFTVNFSSNNFPVNEETKDMIEHTSCYRWNVNGAPITETDAKLWCFIISQDNSSNLCTSVHTDGKALIIDIESIVNGIPSNSTLVYNNCIEYLKIYTKN